MVKAFKNGNQNVFPENIEIVTGGFPCQDFSVAGKRKGFNSHKDHNGKLIQNDIPTEETRGKLLMTTFTKSKKVLLDLQEPENSLDLSQKHYSKAKFMGKHCQGQTEVKLEKLAPTIRAEHHGNIEFRRLSKK